MYSIFLKEKEIKLGAKIVYIYEFLFGICTKEKKKVIQNSHLFILEKGQIYDSQPCMYF